MEDWQKEIILRNMSELIAVTEFNVLVKAKLRDKNVLSQTEVEELDAECDRKGKMAANHKLYERLMTRDGAYPIFIEILEETNQTGAAKILKNRKQNFQIPEDLLGFKDVEIDVQGKKLQMQDFFPSEKLELVQQCFKETIADDDLNDSFVTKKKRFVLATSNIPPEPVIYIPRFISNRIEIDVSIFKVDCPDVFVFRNNIERHKLSQIANPHYTEESTSQLVRITSRFIYLNDYDEWITLKKAAKVPIHLVSYDAEQSSYILEDTTAALDILSKVGSKKESVYMTEDEFVRQQFSNDSKTSSVCICDTPGMGKSYLLANIARKMKEICTGTIVVFIQLSTFVAEFSHSSSDDTTKQDAALKNAFKYITTSCKHGELLMKLFKAELIRVELFFDGFDEIPTEKIEWTKQVFLSLRSKFLNSRIYIASRPQMRHELENSLGVFAYDILPFNIKNQVDYLVQYWSPNFPAVDQPTLENYALNCLKDIGKSLTRSDKDIAGIPLLCRLIAEVYASKVRFYSSSTTKNAYFQFKIAALYKQFIELRTKTAAKTEKEIHKLKMIHIWHALKLLFPTHGFHADKIFGGIKNEATEGLVLSAGIIQLQSSTKLEFMHRTFAEYFVSEYMFEKVHRAAAPQPKSLLRSIFNTKKDSEKLLPSIFNLLLTASKSENVFVYAVVLTFFDFTFNQAQISEEINGQVASFCASISTENLMTILCSCCCHNLYNLFCFLKDATNQWIRSKKKLLFTRKNCYRLLEVCIRESTSQMFHRCIQHITEVLHLDLTKINTYDEDETLLQIAVKCDNYEAVEYFIDRISVKNQSILDRCVNRLGNIEKKRENILLLLLKKDPTLIYETAHILLTWRLDVRLFKILVKFGANLTAVDYNGNNCVMKAAGTMSPRDYHELVEFLLTDCKAGYLFLENEKWEDPLPTIIKRVVFLPKTMELLLKIPGMNIRMKERWEESLLLHAVKANDLNELERLVKRGVDYNARDMENGSLLHEAAKNGGLEMVRYLLSLKLDANYRDELGWTPLHLAAMRVRFSVVEVLVENGANVQAKDDQGKTALHHAARNYSIGECIKIIKCLVRKGAGVNAPDNYGNTPLHKCWNSNEVKECLIEMGADIHATNKLGETPAQRNPDFWK